MEDREAAVRPDLESIVPVSCPNMHVCKWHIESELRERGEASSRCNYSLVLIQLVLSRRNYYLVLVRMVL